MASCFVTDGRDATRHTTATAMATLLLVVGSALATNEAGLAYLTENAKDPEVTTLPSGLQYKILKSGPLGGKSPGVSDPCVCHYTGTLIDGTVFDSSVRRGKPATFAPNRVIKGWTEALQLMHEGDKWALTIPAELAYGARGSPPRIPGGSVLNFELELIQVTEPSAFTILGFDLTDPQTLLIAGMILFFLFRTFGGGGGGGGSGPAVSLDEASSDDNPIVFFDMSIGGQPAGRIEMELFAGHYPKTVPNSDSNRQLS